MRRCHIFVRECGIFKPYLCDQIQFFSSLENEAKGNPENGHNFVARVRADNGPWGKKGGPANCRAFPIIGQLAESGCAGAVQQGMSDGMWNSTHFA